MKEFAGTPNSSRSAAPKTSGTGACRSRRYRDRMCNLVTANRLKKNKSIHTGKFEGCGLSLGRAFDAPKPSWQGERLRPTWRLGIGSLLSAMLQSSCVAEAGGVRVARICAHHHVARFLASCVEPVEVEVRVRRTRVRGTQCVPRVKDRQGSPPTVPRIAQHDISRANAKESIWLFLRSRSSSAVVFCVNSTSFLCFRSNVL